jgi:predicted TIM-barrel fold metal-dependent hydrolase
MPSRELTIPPDACDCHMHVFGTLADYPPAAVRGYTPHPASWASYRAIAASIGLSRTVVVQPSAYGTDNRCTLDAVRVAGPQVRAVAVIDDATPDDVFTAWQAAGVRGIRLNLVSAGEPDGAGALALLRRTAQRVASIGWHIQIFATAALLADILPEIAVLPATVVIDHMGGADASLGPTQPVVQCLAALLRAERVWVKVSGANRVSRLPTGFRDALPIMRALIAANPERLVWGTDWPHIGPHTPGETGLATYLPLDNHGLLTLLAEACDGDQATFDARLVANPGRLYGFAA